LSEASDVFDLSAVDNWIAPSFPTIFSALSENEMKRTVLPLRSSEVRDEFDLSASDNVMPPSVPILLPVLSENEMKQQVSYF
jgi:hypothetical protein